MPVTQSQQVPARTDRSGAFSRVRARYLIVWVLLGVAAIMALTSIAQQLTGDAVPEEVLAIGQYAAMVGWLGWLAFRNGVNLAVPFVWPRLGTLWWVVAAMLPVQMLFSLGSSQITSLVFPWWAEVAGTGSIGQGSLVLALVAVVVLPATVEESVFRFALLERWTVKWRLVVAILVSSLCFGILHGDPIGATAFGVVTSLLYLRTGSLWPGILIHAANNFLALLAIRYVDQGGAPTPSTQETLLTAAVMLIISTPFLAWFVHSWWPRRDSQGNDPETPYSRLELTSALPAQRVGSVVWSGAPGLLLDAAVTDTQVELGSPGAGVPLAVLPLVRVRQAYPSVVPGGQAVVVALTDGSWTTLQAGGGHPARNLELADLINRRAARAAARSLREAGRAAEQPPLPLA